MATISEAVPLALNLSSAGTKVHASEVLNCKNEAVLGIDGEGLSIHRIAPSRALSAFSTGPEVKFVCPPVSIRLDSENTVTYAVTEEKGDITLLRWTQSGVEYSTQRMRLSVKKSESISLHAIDESGEYVLVNYNNTRLECVDVGSSKALWTWTVPCKAATCMRTFNAKDSPVSKDIHGQVLLIIAEQAQYYTLSATNIPSDSILSHSLTDTERTTYTTFDIPSSTIFQLSRKDLRITKHNTPTNTFRLPSQYSQIFPLSTSHVLLTSSDSVTIYDITYGTIQTTSPVPPSTTPLTIISSADSNTYHLLLTSSDKSLVIPLTIPVSSTLLSILTTSSQLTTSSKVAPVLLASKQKFKPKEVLSATKDLFSQLKVAADSKDAKGFDKLFKEFRRKYKVNRGSRKERRTKLTSVFIRELMEMVFTTTQEGGVKMTIYPEETIEFLLDCHVFSRDAIPGTGEDRFVQAALSDDKFLKKLLEREFTPFQFRDFLVLVKKLLESPDQQQRQLKRVSMEMVLESFERNVDHFFDMGDMNCILTTDQLHTLLNLLISPSTSNNSTAITTPPSAETSTIQYPALLTCVLDSIGLPHLFLPTTLPTTHLDSLLSSLTTSTDEISSCLSLSCVLSLALKRHDRSITARHDDVESRKRKRGVEIVAEEGGGQRRRQGWLKRDLVGGQGSAGGMTRFVAQTKFLEVPGYSLDRMVL